MKNVPNSGFYLLVLLVFLFGSQILSASAQTAVPMGETKCYVEENGRKREVACPSSNSNQNNNTNTTPDNSAQEKAERERKEREEEEKRLANEAQKRKEAAERQKKFEKNRDEAVQTLKGGSGDTTIRGSSSGDTKIRDSHSDSGMRETTPVVEPTPTVSNKPAVPRAYEKAVAEAFPNSTSDVTERLRKGFLAIETKDWKVAKAWFQDALNREPENIGIARLVALCDYELTPNRSTKSVSSAKSVPKTVTDDAAKTIDPMTEQIILEDFLVSLNNFYLNYVPKHPELKLSVVVQPSKPTQLKKEESATDAFIKRLQNLVTPPKKKESRTIVSAVRG